MISVEKISKSYGSKKALDNVSLEIAKGKTISLIGPSGCGKSTLLRIIMGLIIPDSGNVYILSLIHISQVINREDEIMMVDFE